MRQLYAQREINEAHANWRRVRNISVLSDKHTVRWIEAVWSNGHQQARETANYDLRSVD
jgi:hypothetical protein